MSSILQIAYSLLLYLFQPIIWLRLWLRGRKAPEYRKRWLERYGFFPNQVSAGGILLHAVSVGETLAAIPLIKQLQQRYPDLPITVTTMTPTGSEQVTKILGNSVHHGYLPYDIPGAMRRFINHIQPKLVIIMETELWPNLISELHRRNIPLVIANARLSEHSAIGYRKLGRFVRSIMQKITLIAAQYQEDKNQFIALGANPDQISVIGSLKFDIAISAKLATDIRLLRQQWALNRPVWIAASTHEGEESLLLAAHQKLLIVFPDLLLILVPRHPERFSLVNKLAQQQGFNTVLRSLGQPPRPDHQVLIGDTMGELMLLYGIADLAFIGGSLVNNGGHNPLEAAVHNIPILMGPHTFNFHQISYKLLHAGGLFTVNDKMSVVHAVTALLNDETYRVSFGEQALRVLQQNQGALQKLLERLDPWLSAVTPHKSR